MSSDQFGGLPLETDSFMAWNWEQIEPFYSTLQDSELTAENLEEWLDRWTHLHALIDETYARLHVFSAQNKNDEKAEKRYLDFVENVYLKSQPFEQALKKKLAQSGLSPEGFERPMANMRSDIDLFREENLPLFAESERLGSKYDKIISGQTIQWQGEERTVTQLKPVLEGSDRSQREKAWRLISERQLSDRDSLNSLWGKLLDLRSRIAGNAGRSGYLEYRWQQMRRFDYTAENCESFRSSIEQVVVPAAARVYERKRRRLGLESLRPWDTDALPEDERPLKPFKKVTELESKAANIFRNVDSELGEQFEIMRAENLLDLENRKGKAPGGFCTFFPVQRRPFIFMNAVGLQDDVRTLLHEAGHSFHDFATGRWFQQWEFGTEFAEVASMAMELLSSPYLEASSGGYYSEKDAARSRINHLENIILFWPYMAVVDAFQHWAYQNSSIAADPAQCDGKWGELWDRFMQGIDYGDFEDVKVTGWHHKLHIFLYPLYYVEYGLAQLGAVQVWANARANQSNAVEQYKRALALGAQPLPLLFSTAGAKFAFDSDTLKNAVELLESVIEEQTARAYG